MPSISAAAMAAWEHRSALWSDGRERGFDCRRDPVDRVGFFDHRGVIKLWWRWIDVAARRNHERHLLLAQLGRDRPHILALQIDVEDGQIEPTFFNFLEGAPYRVTGATHLVAERIEEILEHHGDQGLVLDDQDGTRTGHLLLA